MVLAMLFGLRVRGYYVRYCSCVIVDYFSCRVLYLVAADVLVV